MIFPVSEACRLAQIRNGPLLNSKLQSLLLPVSSRFVHTHRKEGSIPSVSDQQILNTEMFCASWFRLDLQLNETSEMQSAHHTACQRSNVSLCGPLVCPSVAEINIMIYFSVVAVYVFRPFSPFFQPFVFRYGCQVSQSGHTGVGAVVWALLPNLFSLHT